MRRMLLLLLSLSLMPLFLHPEEKRADRLTVSFNAVSVLLGEVQADFAVKYDLLELSLQPGLRFGYPLEGGGWVSGWGVSLRPAVHRYLSRSIYMGLAVPLVWWQDPPNPSLDIDFLIRTGIVPIIGWRYAPGVFSLCAEVGVGIGAQQVFFENPAAYGAVGWFALQAHFGVGLAFKREKVAAE